MKEQMHIEARAHIHSMDGQLDDVLIVEKRGENEYAAEYRGCLYTAFYNWWHGWFVEDTLKELFRFSVDVLKREKHYDAIDAKKLAGYVIENYKEDRPRCARPVRWFLDKILSKEEYEANYGK